MHLLEGKIHNWKYIWIALKKHTGEASFSVFFLCRQGNWYRFLGDFELIRPSLYNVSK